MLITTKRDLMQYVKGKDIAIVPTMGSLHAGHLSLLEVARRYSDYVVVSIFVNPKQFDKAGDLERYPRDLQADIASLPDDVCVYAPSVEEMYPDGFASSVVVGGQAKTVLCGAYRDGHFDGVATVVSKLLLQSQAKYAVFGEKDYQQLMLVRRVVEDLNIRCEVIGAEIMREADGLAMSSRNALLSAEERAVSGGIYQALKAVQAGLAVADAVSQLEESGVRVEYLERRNEVDLSSYNAGLEEKPYRVFFAGYLGAVRLIDNL